MIWSYNNIFVVHTDIQIFINVPTYMAITYPNSESLYMFVIIRINNNSLHLKIHI